MKVMVLDNLQGFATVDEAGEKELSKLKAGSVVTVKISNRRTLSANALLHVWIDQISMRLGDTHVNVKAELKLLYAVPILRADPQFEGFYNKCLAGLTYAERLKSMQYISATSLMSKKQLSACMDNIEKAYSKEGIILKSNKEDENNKSES